MFENLCIQYYPSQYINLNLKMYNLIYKDIPFRKKYLTVITQKYVLFFVFLYIFVNRNQGIFRGQTKHCPLGHYFNNRTITRFFWRYYDFFPIQSEWNLMLTNQDSEDTRISEDCQYREGRTEGDSLNQ